MSLVDYNAQLEMFEDRVLLFFAPSLPLLSGVSSALFDIDARFPFYSSPTVPALSLNLYVEVVNFKTFSHVC